MRAKDLRENGLEIPPLRAVGHEVSRSDLQAISQFSPSNPYDDIAFETSVAAKAELFTRNPFRRVVDSVIGWCNIARKSVKSRAPLSRYRIAKKVHRFKKSYAMLSTRQQHLLAATPYALAAFTLALGFTMYRNNTPKVIVPKPIAPLMIDEIILTAQVDTPEAQSPAATLKRSPAPKAILDSSTDIKTPASLVQYANRRTWLRSQTKMNSKKVMRLRKNTTVTIHPRFPVQDGWVLAQNKAGHVGFVRTRYLSASKNVVSKTQ